MKPRVIRMALAVDYINEYLTEKGIDFNEIADVCDKLISFEVCDKPINEEELEKIALEAIPRSYPFDMTDVAEPKREAFKAGYRKAKEE